MTTHHFHQSLADGRWFTLPLVEQLGNIGSEINRAVRAQGDQIKFDYAVNRALELFYLTLSDDRWRNRRKELARAKELFNAAVLGSTAYDTTLEDLNNYFLQFAIAARINAR